MSTGIETTVYGEATPHRGVDVWTEDSLLRWDWGDVMDIYQGFDDNGARIKSDRESRPSPGLNTATLQARSCPSYRPSRTARKWRYPATTC